MLKVGVTGGIGSGKSIVCQVFETLGIPVFNADAAAQYLMQNDEYLISAITTLLGQEAYKNGLPNREKIASLVFNEPLLLQQLNAIVHPATIAYGRDWFAQQTAPYIIKEAAIFFESGSYKDMDLMIGVSAPAALRLQRALLRDGATEEKILHRMARQMDDDEKMKRCDFVILNDGNHAIIPQVMAIHHILLDKAAQSTSA